MVQQVHPPEEWLYHPPRDSANVAAAIDALKPSQNNLFVFLFVSM